jgi:hypothetical protein
MLTDGRLAPYPVRRVRNRTEGMLEGVLPPSPVWPGGSRDQANVCVRLVDVLAYQRQTMDELTGLGAIDLHDIILRYCRGCYLRDDAFARDRLM